MTKMPFYQRLQGNKGAMLVREHDKCQGPGVDLFIFKDLSGSQ